jgi:hypothetical protein
VDKNKKINKSVKSKEKEVKNKLKWV